MATESAFASVAQGSGSGLATVGMLALGSGLAKAVSSALVLGVWLLATVTGMVKVGWLALGSGSGSASTWEARVTESAQATVESWASVLGVW
jgi:hypothetical protein